MRGDYPCVGRGVVHRLQLNSVAADMDQNAA